MNTEIHKNQRHRGSSRKAAINMIKVAAWAVIAGGIFATPARSQVEPDKGPSDESVAAVDTAPVPQPAPTGPAVANPEPVKPTTPNVAPVVPSATSPAVPDPEVVKPTTPQVLVPKPATTAPASPEVAVPQPTDVKPATTQPVVAKPTGGDSAPTWPAGAQPGAKPAADSVSIIANGLSPAGDITLMMNKSVVLTTKVPYKRVSIAQPDVADVNLVGPSEVLLTAKRPGTTQLILWDDQDRSQIVDVLVNFDLRALETQIKTMFPKAAIRAESANGAIILRGHVPDLHTAQQAVAIAAPYGAAGGGPAGVLNFLEISGGQQVVLQVRFAEVSRSVSQNLGFNAFVTDGKFNLGFQNGPGGAPIGALATGATAGVPAVPIFGSAKTGAASFEFFINALRSNSLLRILAEPNLTAISGEKASFLAGGEFPIPVPQAGSGGTTITIEYKTYGIKLNFTPTVLGDGRVLLHCTPEVSELDYTDSVTLNGYVIPGLTTRNVDTTVELADGQTFALAGLLQNQIKASKNITPLLGDMPVLGALFRSVQYSRSETELVVLVTPRLVEGLNPGQVPKLPGEFWRDPTEAQLFLGADLGGPAPDIRHAPAIRSDKFYGPTGFHPAPVTATPAATKNE
ncbi:MAG TPA: pilus assembly protein N-terminal domain-containing protein [Tepidisphaeraceae bacterium]|jgi:pilus assembly protein CpaC|nr:pilus assembly protein N-terminal domain-containing protein [Tepidisphaeraceae bacterium]